MSRITPVLQRCETKALDGTSEIRTTFKSSAPHLPHFRHWMQPSIRSYTKIVHRVTFGSDTPHVQNRISKSPVNDLAAFIANCHRLLVITGAGVSTDSGVPDYRWPRMPRCCPHLALLHCRGRNGTYVRNPDHRPITYQEFMKNGEQQKRYWVRGLVGFEQFSRAQPNITHRCLRSLEVLFAAKSASCDIVTQNVDRLHYASFECVAAGVQWLQQKERRNGSGAGREVATCQSRGEDTNSWRAGAAGTCRESAGKGEEQQRERRRMRRTKKKARTP